MKNELVGLWSGGKFDSTDSGPSDEFLIFKADGTGYYEISSYFPELIEVFNWRVDVPGHVSMPGTKQLSEDFTGATKDGLIEKSSQFQFEDIPYQIQKQINASGEAMNVLTLILPDRGGRLYQDYIPESYGFVRQDLSGMEDPHLAWRNR